MPKPELANHGATGPVQQAKTIKCSSVQLIGVSTRAVRHPSPRRLSPSYWYPSSRRMSPYDSLLVLRTVNLSSGRDVSSLISVHSM